MAEADSTPHVIEGVEWRMREDPVTGVMGHWSGTQIVYREGLEGKAIEQAYKAAIECDTVAELDNPAIPVGMKIKAVDTKLLWDGSAIARVTWGTPDFRFISFIPNEPKAWSTPMQIEVTRFLKGTGFNQIAEIGDNVVRDGDGRFATIQIPIPAARIYRKTRDVAPPSAAYFEGVGSFELISGVSVKVKRHFPDVKEYTTVLYDNILIHEWRGTAAVQYTETAGPTHTINGWEEHFVAANGTVVGVKPDGAP